MRDPHFFQNCGSFQYNFVLMSVDDHNFERNEDHATVFLKWMDCIKTLYPDVYSLKGIQYKNSVAYFWFSLLLTNPTDISCKKSNENLVNQKLYNTVLILNALYYIDTWLKYYFIEIGLTPLQPLTLQKGPFHLGHQMDLSWDPLVL